MVDTPLQWHPSSRFKFFCLHFMIPVIFYVELLWRWIGPSQSLCLHSREKKKTCRSIIHALRVFRTNNPFIPKRQYRLGLALSNDYHNNNAPCYSRCYGYLLRVHTTLPLLHARSLYAFVLNFPCQFKALLNLRSPTFGFTPFRWLGSITRTTVTPFLMATIIFDLPPLLQNATTEWRNAGCNTTTTTSSTCENKQHRHLLEGTTGEIKRNTQSRCKLSTACDHCFASRNLRLQSQAM